MPKILLHRNAAKFYRNADEAIKSRISDAVDAIGQNPRLDGHVKKLKGELKHLYRFRKGDLRLLYEIDDSEDAVWVKTIEYRGSAYK
jgi:mRNA interferase RelE/StbE